MGRPPTSKQPPAGIYQDSPSTRDDHASAISLHSNIDSQDADDHDDDEALPPYSDDPNASLVASASTAPYDAPPLLQDTHIQTHKNVDARGSRVVRVSPVLTYDPIALKAYILAESEHELQSHICVTGTHTEERRSGHGKETKVSKTTVVDFSFFLDVTNTVSRRRTTGERWERLQVVENERKTFRGGRVKRRDPRFRADVEASRERASLDEWCHRFCASSSKCKTFTLRRVITGRDDQALRDAIETVIRRTRYRGRVDVTFPTHDRAVTVMSDHWANRARTNVFIWWACVLLQLWIITWPALWFMTKRWEVVEVDFPFKKTDKRTQRVEYVLCSEQDFVQRFAYTISQSAVRRVGAQSNKSVQVTWLDEEAERTELQRRDGAVGQSVAEGRGFVESSLGLLRTLRREYSEGQDWGLDD